MLLERPRPVFEAIAHIRLGFVGWKEYDTDVGWCCTEGVTIFDLFCVLLD